MNYYTKILPWENSRRLKGLGEFRSLVIEYFNHSQASWMADERLEEPQAEVARVKINRVVDEVHDIILNSGLSPYIRYTPPAAVGGYIQDIDLLQNIFNLYRFRIAENYLLDLIDRSIGIYEKNGRRAELRAINPLFYIGLILDWVARLPFVLIGRAGFNGQRAEQSLVGRIAKGVILIVTSLASLLTALELLDYLEPVKGLLQRIFGSN